uniref:hypothetical protein n=1 Tax=Streptomyces sp. SID4919 TaxID=2690270 RepID=UPI0031F71664
MHGARAGGEEAVREGREELLAEVTGRRPAELRRARGLTQQVSGREVLARFAVALGGRLRQAIYFDDGDVAAIA